MTILIKELSRFERPALERHFLALASGDRQLRFGIGGALLGRAHIHARNWGVHALFMHCLTENGAIMHLARKQGMDIVTEAGEADAWLKLPPADASTYMSAAFEQRVALFDHALKSQL